MRNSAASLALLLTAMPASAIDKTVPLTKESVRAMPDEELARRVFGDLGHVMYALPRREGRTGFPLDSLDFLTRPRGSYRAGVCETDRIVVGFEPVPFGVSEEAWARRDPEMRPYRFEKYVNYFIQDFDSARTGDPPVEEAKRRLDWTCHEIDPRTKPLISADSAIEIVLGLDSIADLIEAAKKRRALAPLDCKDRSGEPLAEVDCLKELAGLDPLDLYHSAFVEGCNGKDPKVYCRSLTVRNRFGYDLVIEMEYALGGHEALRIRVEPVRDDSSFT